MFICLFIKNCYSRQKAAPFETMLGFICIYGGLAGIFNFGIINNIFTSVISYPLLLLLNIIYLISGITIFTGLGLKRGNLEAFGLVILSTTLIVRTVLIGFLLGFNPIIINSYISNAAFVFACIIRIRTIAKNNLIIEKHGITNGAIKLLLL